MKQLTVYLKAIFWPTGCDEKFKKLLCHSHKFDLPPSRCQLTGVKRASLFAAQMSAFDPKRTQGPFSVI
jgi:hypothetical protein